MNPKKSLSAFSLFGLLTLATHAVLAVEIESPWVRPTAPGAKVGGAFMTLVGGRQADRVLSCSSPVAAAVELHTHIMQDGVAKMRAIPAIDVPAGGQVELKPGGLHLMLINLKAPLKAGDTIPLTLRFEKAGAIEIKVPVANQPPMTAGHGELYGEHQKH